jgi:hypothetical protein
MTRMTPLLERNQRFAAAYTPAPLGPPAAQVLIVTCLDHRAAVVDHQYREALLGRPLRDVAGPVLLGCHLRRGRPGVRIKQDGQRGVTVAVPGRQEQRGAQLARLERHQLHPRRQDRRLHMRGDALLLAARRRGPADRDDAARMLRRAGLQYRAPCPMHP